MKARLNELRKIEKIIANLSDEKDRLEQKLSDNSIYAAENRESLDASLAAQAENSKRLSRAEEDWLRISEVIEEIERTIN